MLPCLAVRRKPLTFARWFRALLRAGRYDVVHSHVQLFSGFVLRLAYSQGVRVRIAHGHSTSDGKAPARSRVFYRILMTRWLRKCATQGFASSPEVAQALFGSQWAMDPRFRLFYYGIDFEPFRQEVSREGIRRELSIPVDVPVVGYVARFMPYKNHAFVLQIAAELLKRQPHVRFLLVGDGPLRSQMEASARELGIANNVMFTGARADVPRLLLGAMDAFLFPSLREGLPLAVVEAQAAGLPCLVSEVVPRDACVVAGAVSYASVAEGPVSWANRLSPLLDNGIIDRSAALNAVAQSEFSVERSTAILTQLYSASSQ